MKVVFDTDVVLDLLLDRQPFAPAATQLFARAERGELVAAVCATTVTTVFYLAERARDHTAAREVLARLLALTEVAPVGRAVLDSALASPMADFEDAVVCAAALGAGADAVVTRNLRDFVAAPLPTFSPDGLLSALDALAAGGAQPSPSGTPAGSTKPARTDDVTT